ncbi:MAG: sigma-70 family RNA polymerase sigma factor [Chloroflexota bacterium]|nr:sigma-70 family RNA polymerase sigma factor [Chloroflexota bacterium]
MMLTITGAGPRLARGLRALFAISAFAMSSSSSMDNQTAPYPTPARGGAGATNREFDAFFQAHERAITGYLWRMTGDEQTASDLAQETFLRAWQRFDRIRAYERPGGWLFRVATNLALQHLRRRGAPVGAAGPLDGAWDPRVSDPGQRFVERDQVRETLRELTPKARALLILRDVYGLSAEEVGDILKMSREAVKVGLWRARTQFRDHYMRKEAR